MPTRLCWKPGILCLPCMDRVGSWRLQEAEELYHVPDVLPMLIGGAAVLMLVQRAAEVRYIPLAPLSTMAVSVLGRLSSSV